MSVLRVQLKEGAQIELEEGEAHAEQNVEQHQVEQKYRTEHLIFILYHLLGGG